MNRQELLAAGSAGLLLAAAPPAGAAVTSNSGKPLTAPKTSDQINVAILVSERATVIDFAGPWEVFQDGGFTPFLVAKTLDPIAATAGLKIVPNYTFETAPHAHVVVVGAQKGTPEGVAWLRDVSPKADVAMSVCTGAFQMGRTGLLDGLYATTHHLFYDKFAAEFPKVKLVRGKRFVENAQISSAGGLTSGMDLALRVFERYYGAAQTQQLAYYLEYKRTQRPELKQA
jgi:transcriptional regulator GlxA family with amidase domain